MRRIRRLEKLPLSQRVLRLLRPNSGLEGSITLQDETVEITVPTNDYYNYKKAIQRATFEAEHKKSIAINEYRKRHFAL